MFHQDQHRGFKPGTAGSSVSWLPASLHPHRALLAVLLAALAIRVGLLAASSTMPLQIQDEQHYAQLASNLLHVQQFAFEPGDPTSMRPPLYPAFVAALWKIAGTEDPQVVRGVQVLLGLFLVVATYALTLRLYSRRAAIAAATVIAFYPSFIYAGVLVLTEVLFTAFVLMFVLLYLSVIERPRAGMAVALGAVLGMAALTRSVLWPFPVVLLPLLFISVRASTRRRLAMAACCLVGYAVIVGPWAVRNTRLQQTLVVVDTMGGMNLRMGNYEHTPEDRIWAAVGLTGEKSWSYELGQTEPDVLSWTVGQKEKWAQRAAIAYMIDHPWTTLRRSVIKLADFWGLERELIAAFRARLYDPPVWLVLLATVGVVVAYPLVALSAAIGVWRAAPADRRAHWLMLAVIGFVMAVHTIVFGHSRYHLPLVPFLAIYAAATWTRGSWRDLLGSLRLAAAPAALMAVLVAAWGHEVLFRDAERIRALVHAWL
jgi:4-amino-4-deoxy-L-arabinose transferase-like glycosyltransferase